MPIIDLSATIAPSHPDAAAYERVEVAYSNHEQGAAQVEALLGVPRTLLRDEEGWAVEEIRLSTHGVTHLDAPWHYNSRIQGRRAPTIDELPLEWFYSDGVVLDMSHLRDEDLIDASEVQSALAKIDYRLKALDIVLLRTGRDAFYGQPDYSRLGCAVTAAATAWLYEQGVRVMGIDAWGWDGPLHRQAKDAIEKQRAGIFWAAHQSDLPYSQIERLVNLGALPPFGFKVACFPLKIKSGSAAPARVVAIIPG